MQNLQKNCSFNEILEIWLDEKDELKVQSSQRYENLINLYLKDTIGKLECSKIKEDDILNFFKKGKISEKSSSTKKAVFYIIRSALEIAYRENYCAYIDLKRLKFKTTKNNITVFTRREQRKLDEYLTTELNVRKIGMLICMYTGIRIGEASGLKWGDINFNNNSITINRTSQRIKKEGLGREAKTELVVNTPKSKSSNRVVPLPNFIIPYLKKFKKEDDYYILSDQKKIYDPRLLESFYERTLKKCKISHLKFHTLRHTFATRCVESGIDPKTLSEILGHASVEITLKLYVHPTYDMKKNQ